MAYESDDIRARLIRMEGQINRMVSDAESEKDVRRDRNKEIDRRLSEIEKWQAKWGGALIALGVIATVCSIVAVVIKVAS